MNMILKIKTKMGTVYLISYLAIHAKSPTREHFVKKLTMSQSKVSLKAMHKMANR